MKLHLVTIGEPKLTYAREGWGEYIKRLGRFHKVRTTHIPDKHNDTAHILEAVKGSYMVAMVIDGKSLSSQQLANFIERQASGGKELSFIVGGPDGLPKEAIEASSYKWSLSALTLPHDLAMVVLAEALYRASSINANQPYHK